MEEHFGSGGVVKKKNSSGCLIIKNKGGEKEKKRPRLILSDSEASHELLEPLKRKIKEFSSRSTTARKKCSPESRKNVRNDESRSERKRSRLDLYDFDEYDEFDNKHMRNNYMAGRSGHQKEYGSGSSKKHIVYKRRRSQANNATNFPCARGKGIDYCTKSDIETEGDEANLPISSFIGKLQKVSDEQIRFQGKNGVLKVMVNKKKKMGISDNHNAQEIKGSKSKDLAKKKTLSQPSFSSDSKRLEKSVQFSKSSKGESTGTGESDASLKQGKESTSDQARSSMKHGENEGKRTPKPTKSVIRIRVTEGKEKRGSGTEKQLVREQIRNMLINAGWTIDYRPRRNRDYLDAVYINPSGTAYWSIIKAYEALQKQLEEEDTDSKHGKDLSHFSPLSEELLNKLTRQTQKKMEREMKRKRRDDSRSKTTKKSLAREFADHTDSDRDEEKLSFCKKHNGKSLRGQLNEAEHVREDNSGDKVYHRKPKRDCITTNSHMAQGRKSKKVNRCTLVVRTCDKGQNSETDCVVPSTGKRTILAWLIDCGVVQSSEKVQYMNRGRTQVLLEGWITRDGIHCSCCSKILTISKFEVHGASKQCQPFQNIILESGISLLQCQIDAWKRQKGSEYLGFHSIDVNDDDPNDDTCGICGDGGDLICCDGCPCTFHQSCLGIQMLPKGDWHCQNCTCKFCGMIADSIVEGNSTTIGLLKACTLCEKKFHVSCCEEDYIASHSRNVSTPFCGKKCQELFDHLQKLLGIKHELGAGYSWSLIHRTDLDSDTVHHRFLQNVECNSKLAVALSIMDECFLPVIDRRSKINLLRSVLYNCGSNFSRLNYSGFYTAILERSEEIISAASIRIHGTQLAEMPFIGTRHAYRRQGMCRQLLCAIESVLCSLKIEKLIIPAIAEHMHTWTVVFGFHPLEESHRQEMKSINMLVFPGTDMLQKQLAKQEKSDGNISAKTVVDDDLKDSFFPLPDLPDSDSSFGHDMHYHNEKVAPMDSGSEVSNVPSKEDILICNSAEVSLESRPQIFSKDTKSESVCEPVECSAKLNYPSIRCPTSLVRETEIASLHTHVKGDIQSTAEVLVSVADEFNIQISCGHSVHDSLGEASIMGTTEVPNESQSKPAFGSTTGEGDESTIRPPSVASVDEIVPVKDDIHFTSEVLVSDADELNTEIADGHSVHDSFGKTSIRDTTEVQNESQKKPIFGSIVHDTHESSIQVASGASGDAKVAPIETDFKSSVEVSKSDNHGINAKVGVEPSSSTLLFISGESTVGKVAQSVNSVSISVDNGAENHMVQINSDANQPTFCTKSELNTSSEHISDAEVASNVLSS